jgi:hypothetical protein
MQENDSWEKVLNVVETQDNKKKMKTVLFLPRPTKIINKHKVTSIPMCKSLFRPSL